MKFVSIVLEILSFVANSKTDNIKSPYIFGNQRPYLLFTMDPLKKIYYTHLYFNLDHWNQME